MQFLDTKHDNHSKKKKELQQYKQDNSISIVI
jgi:hypothetical protein